MNISSSNSGNGNTDPAEKPRRAAIDKQGFQLGILLVKKKVGEESPGSTEKA